jgi:hypothetical protein
MKANAFDKVNHATWSNLAKFWILWMIFDCKAHDTRASLFEQFVIAKNRKNALAWTHTESRKLDALECALEAQNFRMKIFFFSIEWIDVLARIWRIGKKVNVNGWRRGCTVDSSASVDHRDSRHQQKVHINEPEQHSAKIKNVKWSIDISFSVPM